MKEEADVVELLIAGLLTDGAHHKQWALNETLRLLLGDNYEGRRAKLTAEGYWWEDGIPP